ncbi:hypothetical protein EDD16DRAFT_150831 [Pisolithus croceorrhizus]|nr:hypothetical protein EDD16DRAFT_150831 [Pisolithus croceorrhizus]
MSPKRLTFVTGNSNKLIETKYILSQGVPIEIDSADLDSKLTAPLINTEHWS